MDAVNAYDTGMNEITWAEPPEKSTVWGTRLQAFRENPGVWGIVPWVNNDTGYGNSVASSIKHGKFAGITKGQYEARVVRNGTDPRGILYVRYVGK